MKRPTKKPAKGVIWSVYLLRKKAERLGSVQAPTAEAAVKAWLERTPASKEERRRLIARREV
jgi:hypothetical protein